MFPVEQPVKGSIRYFAHDNNLTPKCITNLYMYVPISHCLLCMFWYWTKGRPAFIHCNVYQYANMFCPKMPSFIVFPLLFCIEPQHFEIFWLLGRDWNSNFYTISKWNYLSTQLINWKHFENCNISTNNEWFHFDTLSTFNNCSHWTLFYVSTTIHNSHWIVFPEFTFVPKIWLKCQK